MLVCLLNLPAYSLLESTIQQTNFLMCVLGESRENCNRKLENITEQIGAQTFTEYQLGQAEITEVNSRMSTTRCYEVFVISFLFVSFCQPIFL